MILIGVCVGVGSTLTVCIIGLIVCVKRRMNRRNRIPMDFDRNAIVQGAAPANESSASGGPNGSRNAEARRAARERMLQEAEVEKERIIKLMDERIT